MDPCRTRLVPAFVLPAIQRDGAGQLLVLDNYRLWPSDSTEVAIQAAFSDLMWSWDRTGGMVRTALHEGRSAEWHFMPGVATEKHDHHRCPGQPVPHIHYRAPSRAELRAETNLALSRGAKGIDYYLYSSTKGMLVGDSVEYRGLVDTVVTAGQARARLQPIWNDVRAVNDTLGPLGDALYPLIWVAGFPRSRIPSGDSIFVASATGDSVELATFYAPADSNRDYLLAVNRYGLRADTPQSFNVTISADQLRRSFHGPGVYFVTNVVSGERQVRSTDGSHQFVIRCASMPAGGARLFRIERVDTWSGTVALTGDVTVPTATSLTIQSGATVLLSGTGNDLTSGTFANKVELIANGTLTAQGATFSSLEGATVQWGGLFLNGPVTLHGCTISNATYGARVGADSCTIGGNALSDGSVFSACDYGVYAMDRMGTVIRNNKIDGTGQVGIYLSGGTTTVQQNLLRDTQTYGIEARQGTATILNNTLDMQVTNSATGIYLHTGCNATLTSDIAQGFYNGGIRTDSTSSSGIVAQYYLSRDNDAGTHRDLAGTLAATRRALFSDPRYVNRQGSNFHLSSTSPGLDAGDSTPQDPSPHTGRIDIGRYGGTSEADSSLGPILMEDYFVSGSAPGWSTLSGTAGTWSGDAAQGTYKVTGVNGVSQAYKDTTAADYPRC